MKAEYSIPGKEPQPKCEAWKTVIGRGSFAQLIIESTINSNVLQEFLVVFTLER